MKTDGLASAAYPLLRLGGHVERAYETDLRRLVRATGWLVRLLESVRATIESEWCVGAGVVRDLVWSHLHGQDAVHPRDVDVAFFGPEGPSDEGEYQRT